MNLVLPIKESPPPFAGEEDPDFIVLPWSGGYLAFYRHEEWYEFNGEAKGEGPCPDLAKADLVRRFPREA